MAERTVRRLPAGAAFLIDGHDGLEFIQNSLVFALVEPLHFCHGLAPLQSENNLGNFLAASLAQNFDAMGDSGLIHVWDVEAKAVE